MLGLRGVNVWVTALLGISTIFGMAETASGSASNPPASSAGASAAASGTGTAGAAGGAEESFSVAHIASPLVRSHLPGHSPSIHTRSRLSLGLLESAIDTAKAKGADAIVVTGSIISAPPPLRNCDAHGYYPLEKEQPLSEAEADYGEVRALLEGCGLPFEVTPGGEDCIEAFEKVFGTHTYATTLGSINNAKMDFSHLVGEESYNRTTTAEEGAVEEEEVPAAPLDRSDVEDPSIKAIADFKKLLEDEKKAKEAGGGGGGQQDQTPLRDLEEAAEDGGGSCGSTGGGVGCGGSCHGDDGGGGSGKGKAGAGGSKEDEQEIDESRFPRVPLNSTHKRGWSTPEGERPSSVVLARFCDHVPLSCPPRRLEYERKLWEGLISSSDPSPQIHVSTFSPAPIQVGGEGEDQRSDKRGQADGEAGVDGVAFYEHASLRKRMEASGKLILCLSSLPPSLSPEGSRASTDGTGRVTTLQSPSLAVYPHTFTISRLHRPKYSIDPRLSQSPKEVYAKRDVIQHKHFWGHEEVTVPAPSRPQPGGIVFLDRDGVVNTLPKYSTGPSEMAIVPGAGLAIARLQMTGLRVVIVSSQSCIGRGYVSTSTVHSVMDRMCRLLRDEVSSSGDDDMASRSRTDNSLGQPDMITFSVGDERAPISDDYADVYDAKPRPLGLIRAAKALCAGKDVKLVDGYMVGDRVSDVRAGCAAGCKSILVKTGLGKEAAAEVGEGAVMHVADDILVAAQAIIEDFGRKKPQALR